METVYTVDDLENTAKELLKNLTFSDDRATVLGLAGDIGAGKTTLIKSLANILGVEENVTSPTFVIAKFYETKNESFKKLIHIDAYRIDDSSELDKIGWEEILKEPNSLVVVEWPTRILNRLPEHTHNFEIEHGNENRIIKMI